MNINEELGFSPDDIILVVHADDMGMCRATNHGCLSLLQKKVVPSASVMVPCPGFDEVAEMAQADSSLDLGVHLTLVAEGGDEAFWRPVSDDVPSLVNDAGIFYTEPAELFKNATLEDIEKECRAQIERAISAGIDVTHIDSHMGNMFEGSLILLYAKLAIEYGVVCMLPVIKLYDTFVQRYYIEAVKLLHEHRWPGVFHISPDIHPDASDDPTASFELRLQLLQPGINYWIVHPADPAFYDKNAIFADPQERSAAYGLYSDHWASHGESKQNFFDSVVDGVVSMGDVKKACALKDTEETRRILYSY